MDQLIFASLSHTHYWYEVSMLKVPAVIGTELRDPINSGLTRCSSRLTRDGTAEQGQGNIPCSADHEQDWQPYLVDLYSAIIMDDHAYIHTHTCYKQKHCLELVRTLFLGVHVCRVTHIARVWINLVRLPILLVVS